MISLDINVARSLPVLLIDSATRLGKTGVTEGSVTVKISKNLGTLTSFTLTGKWTEIGQGLYKIAFAASDLDTEGFFGYLVTATGCDQYSGMMYVSSDLVTLLARLTAARAGYLDNLSAGAVALEATLTAIKGAEWTDETLKALKEALDELISGAAPPGKADFKA